MRKVQLGCGGNKLDGWENYDFDVDITKTLPFNDLSIKYIFAEHVLEHIHVHDAFRFLKEAYRVLEVNGTIRICVPGLDQLFNNYNENYANFIKFHNLGDGSIMSAMNSIIYNFGHQAVYTVELLEILCKTVGFKTKRCKSRVSDIVELNDIDSHWKPIGDEINKIETVVVEATR